MISQKVVTERSSPSHAWSRARGTVPTACAVVHLDYATMPIDEARDRLLYSGRRASSTRCSSYVQYGSFSAARIGAAGTPRA